MDIKGRDDHFTGEFSEEFVVSADKTDVRTANHEGKAEVLEVSDVDIGGDIFTDEGVFRVKEVDVVGTLKVVNKTGLRVYRLRDINMIFVKRGFIEVSEGEFPVKNFSVIR